jgi:hypothetical protein
MTTIQTHEAELRAMMERAGLASAVRGTIVGGQAPGKDWSTPIAMVTEHPQNEGMFVALYGQTDDSPRHTMGASHTDPRVALRACLEMAGLLTDRPPQTDAELVRWLTVRHGDGVLDARDGLIRWPALGEVLYDPDDGDSERRWSRASSDEWCPARELGAILWCAERFPEVKP